jgi:uncharacterized protein
MLRLNGMLLDAHVHVGPWRLQGLEALAPSLDDAVRAALREGIGGVAVTISDGGDNGDLRTAVADEDRIDLWFVPWIRPGTRQAEEFLDSAAGPRVAALKLHPSIDRTPVTDAAYDRAFDAAGEAGVPVLIHTGRWQEVAGFEHALRRAIERPALRVILAHAGGNDFLLRRRCCDRIAELDPPNLWLDLTGLGMPLTTRTLVERVGYTRFLFGSDYPLGHPRVQLAHVTAMDLPAAQEAAILGETARALLGEPSNRRGRGRRAAP